MKHRKRNVSVRMKRGLDVSAAPYCTSYTDINNTKHNKRLNSLRLSQSEISKEISSFDNLTGVLRSVKLPDGSPSVKFLQIENQQLKEKIKSLRDRNEKLQKTVDYLKQVVLNPKQPARIPRSTVIDSIPDMRTRSDYMINKDLIEIFKKELGGRLHYGRKQIMIVSKFVKRVRKYVPSLLKSMKDPESFFIKYHIRTIKREKRNLTVTPNLLCSTWAYNFTLAEMQKEKVDHGKLFL